MIGFLFIYFIFNFYSKLALKYDKNKWVFGFIGLLLYYATTFAFGVLYAIIYELLGNTFTDSDANNIYFQISAFGVGIGVAYGINRMLEIKWEREKVLSEKDSIDSIGENLE